MKDETSRLAIKSMTQSYSMPGNSGAAALGQQVVSTPGFPVAANGAAAGASATQSRSNGVTSTSNNNVVGVHYKIGRKIGEGSFGIIYEGKRTRNNSQIRSQPTKQPTYCY
jgi:hypothetical protein